MTIQEFIDKYREAFGEAAPLPIALGYSDTPASEVGSVPKCMIGRISIYDSTSHSVSPIRTVRQSRKAEILVEDVPEEMDLM